MLKSFLNKIASIFSGASTKAPPPSVNPSLLPRHYTIAKAELGQKEISGSKHNPRIIEYHKKTTLLAKDDETAWCASFVNWCLSQAGIMGTQSAMARSFLKFGKAVVEPIEGDIVIFKRGAPPSGHVAFFVRMDESSIWCLGGNQSNQVNVSKYKRSDLLGFRRV